MKFFTYWAMVDNKWVFVTEPDETKAKEVLRGFGKVASWTVWDRQLTKDEIAALAAGANPMQFKPIEHWPLDEGGK